ncbi:MAG: bifunctional adenosylcobinamide kinase/adenosylcobinamide-phosphate guanylyltransferase [Bryobacteraceae bacterium]
MRWAAHLLATAQALDEEMQSRIDSHRAGRGPEWTSIEEPLNIVDKLGAGRTIVVDCLTLWLSNLILAGRDVAKESDAVIAAARASSSTIIFVTNEVGCGIVPENELSRRFRDNAGWLNQRIAEVANEVYWMAFGCPLRVK